MNGTVAVLGPGAVGGALAVRLTLAGVHTVCVGPPETVGMIALAGLTVESRDGTLSARPEVRERLQTPVSLLLVTVKAPALEEALERVDAGVVEEGVAVPLLNGLEHMEVLHEAFDGRVAAGSVSAYQAYRPGRVQIVEASAPPLVTIASDTLSEAELEGAAGILRGAGIEVLVGGSEKRVLWHKLVRIAPLAAATAATGRSVGELRKDFEWRQQLQAAIREACAVATADGVPLQFSTQWAIVEDVTDDATTSAARDVAAGRASELDALVGAVLRAAERLDVPTPALRELATSAGLR